MKSSWPNFYKSFTVNNQTFTELTVEAIELIKCREVVYLEINSPQVQANLLRQLQMVFHRLDEHPTFDLKYQDRCVLLRKNLNL
jgi:hypothetical protein